LIVVASDGPPVVPVKVEAGTGAAEPEPEDAPPVTLEYNRAGIGAFAGGEVRRGQDLRRSVNRMPRQLNPKSRKTKQL
jgi:hypothetical protein